MFRTRGGFEKLNLLPSGWELVFKMGCLQQPANMSSSQTWASLVLMRHQDVGKGNKRWDNSSSDKKIFEGKLGSGVWPLGLKDGGRFAGHLLYPGERGARLLRIRNESVTGTPAHQAARDGHYPSVKPHQGEVVIFISL